MIPITLPPPDAEAAIAALVARGAAQGDPVGLAHAQALARRCATAEGDLHEAIAARLARALDACTARLDAKATAAIPGTAPCAPHARAHTHEQSDPPNNSLRELLARLAAHAGDASAAEPRALRQARETWMQLDVQRQVAQSMLKAVPQAGPLNSHHLVLRALQWMQQTSPGYLGAFVGHVETLLWLSEVPLAPPPPPRSAARGRK